MKEINNNGYTVVDLFCGAGGLSKGFMDAGFDVKLGIDFDDAALNTFSHNHGDAEAFKLDLFDLNNVEKIKEKLSEKGVNQLDVLIGGPPCQGFSLAGNRVESDERNTLYKAMVKTAKVLKPRAVLLENVPGMLTLYGGKVKEKIFSDFEELGYTMNVKVLYAPEYGVPQIRKRAIFVGLLDSKSKFVYPDPILDEDHFITCEQAISDLPSLENDKDFNLATIRDYAKNPESDYQTKMRSHSDRVYNHTPTNHAQKTIDHIALVPDGGKYTDLPPELSKNFKYHESLHRYNSKKPSLTIDTGHRTHFHYKYNRIPTVRENARLQSFPDDFIFYGNKQQQYKQVGNAVPPLLGYAVAKKIESYFENGNDDKIRFIDLFAGCGGLFDGFMQSGEYEPVASVEWEKAPVEVLRNRLKTKWKVGDPEREVINFDIQREEELFTGFDDPKYGKHPGLDALVGEHGVDVVIGGPPCQAYSIAGRNANRMDGDYRNYLFEHYISILKRYQPKLFVFENVPGMLSAMPDGTLITDLIKRDLKSAGYHIIENIKDHALIDMSQFGVPQTRKRVILIGVKDGILDNPEEALKDFYDNILEKFKVNKVVTLEEAIGDLPPIYPVPPHRENGKNISHKVEGETNISWQVPRYQNLRDIEVFKKLAEDIEQGTNKYTSIDQLIQLYKETTGKSTAIHKYHVLRKDEPSTTVLAHLSKDGFRFIHYDSKQARTITVREAARIQTFADDFEFPCSMGAAYKMIGNAVPSLFALKLSKALKIFMDKFSI